MKPWLISTQIFISLAINYYYSACDLSDFGLRKNTCTTIDAYTPFG